MNLPLINQGKLESQLHDREINCSKDQENMNIYENLPLKPPKPSAIYENLPLDPCSAKKSAFSSMDSLKYEDEFFQTMQYFEDTIGTVAICSEESDCEDAKSIGRFESSYSSVDSNFDDSTSLINAINDKKFTDSSSSFEEYQEKEQLPKIQNIIVQPETLIQRFAKESRVSAFIEELEPGASQEFKDIPAPKSKITVFDRAKRFSVPLQFVVEREDVQRPHSLGNGIADDSQTIQHLEDFQLKYKKTEQTDDGLIMNDSEEKESEISKSKGSEQSLNLSYAKESRISKMFEEEEVGELELTETCSENSVIGDESFIENLREDVVTWMTALMEEYCEEWQNIMEETELLKSINEVPKDTTSRLVENKFPYDVEIRRKPDIHINRLSKTTDFDVGRRKPISKVNPKNFEIRGLMKIQASFNVKSDLIKCKEEYIAYENENFYRINERNKNRELLYPDVLLKSVRYLKSKEVELKSTTNDTFILHFQEPKHVKIFMDNDKIQVYNIIDNKVTIKKTLLRFLGKRSSKEFLERKGIYKDEPIFGNTLREIKNRTGYLVPPFITEVIRLLEIPENIQSLGLYRTSGNLAIIQKIRFEVDNGKLSILERYSKDPDVLTGSIKLFFRELKEPLIPLDVGEKLLDIIKLSPQQFTSKEHQKIKSILVKNLDESNLETFVVIMEHLLEVVKHKEHNKMDTYNLAVCWGPSIFTLTGASIKDAIEQSKDIVSLSHNAMSLVSFFLVYYDMYPVELITLRTRVRTNSRSDNIQTLRRQASRESDSSLDSSRSQKKSSSNLSLSVDEVVKRLVDLIEPHVACGDLYVKGGSADKTNKIMKKLTKKKINELEKHKNDVYELTDALKKYLKEQDSLINEQTVEAVLKISPDTSQNCLEPTTRRKVIYLIEDTPKKDTLIFLLRHLARVIEYQERNLNVEKDELINIWSNVLNNQKKIKIPIEDFNKFLIIAILVFNDNLPDIVRSSFNSKTSNSTRSDSMDELMKEMKHQQAERDRNSRYDNVDGDAGEASILDEKTELTKL
ncbi:uncharacterized protein LOC109544256 isoform X2 [Dendroctonus ponderosae]|nr:uncharacterized protein LOC109544256 isoform X2 [Dendroctonus ponderosae]